jgi:hypothetical protein
VAWTSPKTWSFGEILTSTDMNTYVRDNTQELFDRSVGIGSNVVSVAKVDTFTTTSATPVTITGMAATITPTSASSKVLVIFQLSAALTNTTGYVELNLRRGSTKIFQSTGGSILNGTWTGRHGAITDTANASLTSTYVFLDSPSTTSATTYDVQVNTGSGTFNVNRSTDGERGATSSITVIEVVA